MVMMVVFVMLLVVVVGKILMKMNGDNIVRNDDRSVFNYHHGKTIDDNDYDEWGLGDDDNGNGDDHSYFQLMVLVL